MIKNRTFLLFIANILLATLIVFNINDEPSETDSVGAELSQMLAEMEEIEFIQPTTRQKIILRKNLVSWKVVYPIEWPVEAVSLANLISKISHLNPSFICSSEELEIRGEIPEDYGFDENSSILKIKDSGSFLQFTIGHLTRDQNGRYLKISNSNREDIWRGPKKIDELVNRALIEWTDLTYINLPLYSIDTIEVIELDSHREKSHTSLTKKNNDWFFSLPHSSPANNVEVSKFFHNLVSQKLNGFVKDEMDQNVSKVLEVTLGSRGKENILSFFKLDDVESSDLLVKSSEYNNLFYVPDNLLETFQNLSVKLREKRLFALSIEDVSRIKMIETNQSLTLSKNEQGFWVGLEDNGTDLYSFAADDEKVRELIHNLNAVEVTQFIHFNPNAKQLDGQGFNRPQLRLEVKQKNNRNQKILISKSNSESSLWNTYVTEQSLICLVNTAWDNLLSTNSLEYKNRKLLPLEFLPERIVFKSLKDDQTLLTFTYEENGETFERVLDFKADYFLDLTFNKEGIWADGDWLPWKYSLLFDKPSVSGSQPLMFYLTDRVGGTKWFAGSEEIGVVCNLPISVIDELDKVLSAHVSDP